MARAKRTRSNTRSPRSNEPVEPPLQQDSESGEEVAEDRESEEDEEEDNDKDKKKQGDSKKHVLLHDNPQNQGNVQPRSHEVQDIRLKRQIYC